MIAIGNTSLRRHHHAEDWRLTETDTGVSGF